MAAPHRERHQAHLDAQLHHSSEDGLDLVGGEAARAVELGGEGVGAEALLGE